MEINQTKQQDIVIFEIHGKVDALNSKELENALLNSIEEGNTKIVIDLRNMEYISSSGLRVFLFIAKKLDKVGLLALTNLQTQVIQIFTISGFDKILKIFQTKEEALLKL